MFLSSYSISSINQSRFLRAFFRSSRPFFFWCLSRYLNYYLKRSRSIVLVSWSSLKHRWTPYRTDLDSGLVCLHCQFFSRLIISPRLQSLKFRSLFAWPTKMPVVLYCDCVQVAYFLLVDDFTFYFCALIICFVDYNRALFFNIFNVDTLPDVQSSRQ